MIDILVPVLGRPQRVAPLVENIEASTDISYDLLFICSDGDSEEIQAVEEVGCRYLTYRGRPAHGQYGKKINMGYRDTSNPWLLLAADDLYFHLGWAEIALSVAGDRFHVISMNDRGNAFVRQGTLATHSLVRRSYVDDPGCSLDGPGKIYHEGYSHNFVDCELSVLARNRGVFRFAKNATLEHLHPLFRRKTPMDATYEAGLKDFAKDRSRFVKRMTPAYERDRLVRRFAQADRGQR